MSAFSGSRGRRSIKSVILALFCGLVMISLTACLGPLYREEWTPHDTIGSEWQSDDPFLYLKVQDDRGMKGYMLLNAEKVEIQCSIQYGHEVLIIKNQERDTVYDSDFVLEGTCDCTEQQVIITVEKDYCFDGRYDRIVLNRIDGAGSSENG
jgi:hypothetical protein